MEDAATDRLDLSAMLADAHAAGAYYVDESGRDALVLATSQLDFALAAVDLRGCQDKDDALARIASAFAFPEWFGGNWDALADCLNDLSWLPADGYVLLLDHAHAWQQADPVGFEVLLETGNDVATGWAEHGVAFWLLIPVPPGQLAG